MWNHIHRLKALCMREHTSLNAPYRTEARHRTRITLHVSSSVPNRTTHNMETVLTNVRLYKGELASLSRYTSLFITLSTHSLSSITDLSVGVLTCLQASFVPPRRFIIVVPEVVVVTLEHILCHRCHSIVLTGQITNHKSI